MRKLHHLLQLAGSEGPERAFLRTEQANAHLNKYGSLNARFFEKRANFFHTTKHLLRDAKFLTIYFKAGLLWVGGGGGNSDAACQTS